MLDVHFELNILWYAMQSSIARAGMQLVVCTLSYHVGLPLPSNRHHRSNGDCLEGKRENYPVCSVQYCVQQVDCAMHTPMNRPNSSQDWVLSHWAHFTVLRFIFVYVLLHICVVL